MKTIPVQTIHARMIHARGATPTPVDRADTRAGRIVGFAAAVATLCALVAGLQVTDARAAIVDDSMTATADLEPTRGSEARGEATFTDVGAGGMRIVLDVTGLASGSRHGLHIHEKGDCSAPDASSAGPHFSLKGQSHGDHSGSAHHAGDLGNLQADADGRARVSLTVPSTKLTVGSGPLSVVGRAIVVHAKADDLSSQPAGDSGARIACGVIERRTVGDGRKPMTPVR